MRGAHSVSDRIQNRVKHVVEIAGAEYINHLGERRTQWHLHSVFDNPEFATQAREKIAARGIACRVRRALV